MEVKGRAPVLMLDGKAANRALPEWEGAKPGGADTETFFYQQYLRANTMIYTFSRLGRFPDATPTICYNRSALMIENDRPCSAAYEYSVNRMDHL